MTHGVPLQLTFAVGSVANAACAPLAGATVDIWHCDALGRYSDEQANNTVGKKFLRGSQTTDASGLAQFTTIYPGWYAGRAVHIHFKIRTTGTDGQAYEFTSQLFFDDALSDSVFAQAPYASHGTRDTLNSQDSIYGTGGDQLLLALTQQDTGYTTTFNVGLDLADASVGKADGGAASGSGGPGGAGRRAPSGRGSGWRATATNGMTERIVPKQRAAPGSPDLRTLTIIERAAMFSFRPQRLGTGRKTRRSKVKKLMEAATAMPSAEATSAGIMVCATAKTVILRSVAPMIDPWKTSQRRRSITPVAPA